MTPDADVPVRFAFLSCQSANIARTVTMFITPEEHITQELYDDPALASLFSTERFKVDAGSRALWRDFDGAWKMWDPASNAWV